MTQQIKLTKRAWAGYKKSTVLDVLQPGEEPRHGAVDASRADLLVSGGLAADHVAPLPVISPRED